MTGIKFVQHGENTTFRVFTEDNSYLLRIHRNNYHTPEAIGEELEWLNFLNKSEFFELSSPLSNSHGELVTNQETEQIPDGRSISVLSWQQGRIFNKTPLSYVKQTGGLCRRLHDHGLNYKPKHRNYWTPKGLIGINSNFGSFKSLKAFLTEKQYDKLSLQRKEAYTEINGLLVERITQSSYGTLRSTKSIM